MHVFEGTLFRFYHTPTLKGFPNLTKVSFFDGLPRMPSPVVVFYPSPFQRWKPSIKIFDWLTLIGGRYSIA